MELGWLYYSFYNEMSEVIQQGSLDTEFALVMTWFRIGTGPLSEQIMTMIIVAIRCHWAWLS